MKIEDKLIEGKLINILDMYKKHGEELMYGDLKLRKMDNMQIKKEIYSINLIGVYPPWYIQAEEWICIFNEVLKDRRKNKLNKIINNINE